MDMLREGERRASANSYQEITFACSRDKQALSILLDTRAPLDQLDIIDVSFEDEQFLRLFL